MKRIISLIKSWFEAVSEPFALIKDNFGSLVAYEVFFRVLAFLVLFPIIAWAEKLWLVGTKTNVIAWYNVGSFIKNPISWIVLIFMMAVLVWGAMVEQLALYDTMHASKFGVRRTVTQIISAGFGHCFDLSKPGNWLFIPYAILILRFGTLTGDISSVISVIQIPGFILEDFSKRPWEGIASDIGMNEGNLVATLKESLGCLSTRALRTASSLLPSWYT